jgi:hypothetical protein
MGHDYATVFSIYSTKLVQAVYTKRCIETFDFSNIEEQEFIHFFKEELLKLQSNPPKNSTEKEKEYIDKIINNYQKHFY